MVPLYFTDGPLRVYEQEMRHPPYERRPGGGLYVCPSTTAAPSLPSHTQVSKMSYRQLVSERFHGLERSLLWQRIEALTAGAAGLHYNGAGHLERIRACQTTDGPIIDPMDRLVLDNFGLYINCCPDQDFLKGDLLPVLIPAQIEAERKAFGMSAMDL